MQPAFVAESDASSRAPYSEQFDADVAEESASESSSVTPIVQAQTVAFPVADGEASPDATQASVVAVRDARQKIPQGYGMIRAQLETLGGEKNKQIEEPKRENHRARFSDPTAAARREAGDSL